MDATLPVQAIKFDWRRLNAPCILMNHESINETRWNAARGANKMKNQRKKNETKRENKEKGKKKKMKKGKK